MNLNEFVQYTKKADEIIIKAFADTGFSVPEANILFGHILSAQHIWAKRILNEKPNYAVWEQLKPKIFIEVYQTNMQLLDHIIDTKTFTEEVSYGNSAGETFHNTVEEILLHVCNHGTYHRGQLAKMLKQAGYEVPYTDYIILKRQNIF
ncbi:DinB family protein [Pedobacter sp. ASV28]|uniref:DinB family protein n=1 Tax=Pedobacter sp. ASV28 TaxID=2795123 RepID=UPI0018EB9B24|nr:DinB family protein [Pedobacter sp. ASV28]